MDYWSTTLHRIQSSGEEKHAQSLLWSFEFFLLFTATTFTRWLVPRVNARARSFSPRQERNVFSGPGIMLLKGHIGFVAARAFYATPATSMSSVLARRFNMWLPMCFGYAFELVHRSLSPGLVCHHAGSQIATYLWWSSTLFRPQSVMFAFSEMFLTIFIFGVGIHGGAAEVVDFIRHLAPEGSKTARWVARGLAKSVWLSFAWQWTTIIRLVLAHRMCLTEYLSPVEQVVWSLCFLVFFYTQIGSIRSMNAVAWRSWGPTQSRLDCQKHTHALGQESGSTLKHATAQAAL